MSVTNYSFSKGIGGVAFSNILIGGLNNRVELYDEGISQLEEMILNLGGLNEIEILTIANSLCILDLHDFVEFDQEFYKKFDEMVVFRFSFIEISFADHRVFLFLIYIAYRLYHFKTEYQVLQSVVNILSDLIIKIESLYEEVFRKVKQHLKFFYFCELMIGIFIKQKFCSRLISRLQKSLSDILRKKMGDAIGHKTFSELYYDYLQEEPLLMRSVSSNIQRLFISPENEANIDELKEIIGENFYRNSILNSMLGVRLWELTRNTEYLADISFLINFTSHRNNDISFRPAS